MDMSYIYILSNSSRLLFKCQRLNPPDCADEAPQCTTIWRNRGTIFYR